MDAPSVKFKLNFCEHQLHSHGCSYPHGGFMPLRSASINVRPSIEMERKERGGSLRLRPQRWRLVSVFDALIRDGTSRHLSFH